MNPLERRLADLIALDGPLPVSRFMAEALLHPEHGYYTRRDPFGRAGDFTTAPEISQMFGELLGLWCADIWQRSGAPDRFNLIELGPGRGTLMADALRAARSVPAFRAALRPHLVEASPALRASQQALLADSGATWHDNLATAPHGPFCLLANEFFDALPIRQFVRQADGWHERLVGLDDTGNLCFVAAPSPSPVEHMLAPAAIGAPAGSIAEISAAARAISAEIGGRITANRGAALIVDYGPAQSAAGDTLQAVRAHRYHPVLEQVGSADLTAHVDFQALAEAAAAAGARAFGPIAQGDFLQALGIGQRAAALAAKAGATQREAIAAALQRLTAPDAMGTLFKVLALAHSDFGTPAGFTHDHRPPA